MNGVRQAWLMFVRKITATLRQPVWLLSGLMTPLLYLALFAPLLQGMGGAPKPTAEVLDSFVPGLLTLLAFSSGMGAGWTVIWELQSGVIERFRVTPASRFSLMIGPVLGDVVSFAVPALVVLAVSGALGFRIHLSGLAVLMVLLCLLTAAVSAWSASLGLTLREISGLAAVVTGLQLPLTLLSGALLPIAMGPKWLQILAHIDPLYYTVAASRRLAGGVIACNEVLAGFAVIVPLTALVLWWATGVYRKAVS